MRVACALVAVALPIAVVAGGCGGPSKQPTPAPAAAPTDTQAPVRAPDDAPDAPAPDAAIAPDPQAPEPLTAAQCEHMVDHMIDVQLEARRAAGDDAVPKPAAVDKIRRDIKADFVPQCVEQFTRAVFDCWLAASTAEQFEACAGGRATPPATDDA